MSVMFIKTKVIKKLRCVQPAVQRWSVFYHSRQRKPSNPNILRSWNLQMFCVFLERKKLSLIIKNVAN